MNFRKLPKERRDKLVLVVVCALSLIAGLYFLLIRHQNENLDRLAQKKVEVRDNQRRVLDAIRRASQIEADLASAKKDSRWRRPTSLPAICTPGSSTLFASFRPPTKSISLSSVLSAQ